MSFKHVFIIIAGGIAATFFIVGSNLYGSELKFPSRGGGETIVINLADRDEARWLFMVKEDYFIAALRGSPEFEDALCEKSVGTHTWALGHNYQGMTVCGEKPDELKVILETDVEKSKALCRIMFNMRYAGFDGLKLICTAEDEKPTAGAGHVNSGILRRM